VALQRLRSIAWPVYHGPRGGKSVLQAV
jgi:hypothetical protein